MRMRLNKFLVHGRRWTGLLSAGLGAVSWLGAAGELPVPPEIQISFTNGQRRLELPLYPGAEAFVIQSTDDLGKGFTDDFTGQVRGYAWTAPLGTSPRFHRLKINPVGASASLAAVVLNRLAYGQTPDELERVATGPGAIGPDAYVTEQLAPERISEDLDAPFTNPTWRRVAITGVASSSILYLYIDTPGDVYLDDVALVTGTQPEVGVNLIKNGDFESALAGPWTVSTNLADSTPSTETKHGGASSLHMVASSGGTTRDSAIWQTITPALTVGRTYTLSYWYLPSTNGNNLTVRLSQSANYAQGIDTTHGLVPADFQPGVIRDRLDRGVASVDDLRAWFVLHAVRSKRQLLEVLSQFMDNHFTTEYSKSLDYISGLITNQTVIPQVAVNLEFRELANWRATLSNPNGTFYDLLKTSAESPAMIIYLDTVTSAGGNANENYSRELLELFTMGVDNGYDQTDIEQMARAWTGWRVDKLPLAQASNPFSSPVANRDADPGVWALRYRTDRHDTQSKTIFRSKTIDARFGAPYAGRSYQLILPARTGTAGMQDGYDIVRHLADLAFTQEYISVKLCRLFVHEDFHHGVYDFSDPANLSAEGRLVQACMAAWERPAADGRKGNLRQVLGVIFASDLFRSHAAGQQKVKTPLEFVASTIRALRGARPEGGFTADTDGYDVLPSMRRLNMKVFDRAEPDGWSEYGRDWISTAALVERMRFAQNFMIAPRNPLKVVDFGVTGQNNVADPSALIKIKLPSSAWRDAGAVADYFLALLFPGEGRANLDLDRTTALSFLDTNDTGAASPFSSLTLDSAAYDTRVRGLVALLLGMPRFQEQ